MELKPKLNNPINLQFQQALNAQKSQGFGRQIYLIKRNEQNYWLKIQLKKLSRPHEYSFINELNQYEWIAEQNNALLAPFEIVQVADVIQHDHHAEYLEYGLLIEDLPLFFSEITTLSKREVISRLQMSLNVLEQLHGLHMIHGDLKAEHFRQHQNHAVLIDFEQSFHFKDQVKQENTATPRYMAPELFYAEPKTIQTDVYALGIIWLEWLTQQKLQAKTYHDWAILHCQCLNPTLKAEFYEIEQILRQLLIKDKSKRCTNFYQIKQQLSQIV